jgi:hypothetical protein
MNLSTVLWIENLSTVASERMNALWLVVYAVGAATLVASIRESHTL